MPVLRFDLQTAYKAGFTQHPQQVLKDLGYKVLSDRTVTIFFRSFKF